MLSLLLALLVPQARVAVLAPGLVELPDLVQRRFETATLVEYEYYEARQRGTDIKSDREKKDSPA